MTDPAKAAPNKIRQDWLERLIATRNNAYAPYSKHAVAALVVTSDGKEYFSCNVETAHYKSVCAEAGAISAMVSEGHTRISEVWVLGPGPDPCPPCGDCRQRIHELAEQHTAIHLIDDSGSIVSSFSVPDLLPKAFGGRVC